MLGSKLIGFEEAQRSEGLLDSIANRVLFDDNLIRPFEWPPISPKEAPFE